MNKRILKALLGAVSLALLATGAARAATIDDLTLKVALDDGRLEEGSLVVLCSFGAGFTWGSALVRY